MLVFVTGPRGAGKTTFCERLFRSLTVEVPLPGTGIDSLAILSHRQADDNGYDLEVLRSSPAPRLRAPLARRSEMFPDWTGAVIGPWVFSRTAFGLAENSFEEAFEGLKKGGLLVLDEVGPLELKHGRGFSRILPWIPELPRAVVVIRPGLLGALASRLGSSGVIEVEPGMVDDGPGLQGLLRRAGEALG